MGWESTIHPFSLHDAWAALAALTADERRRRLADPAVRASLLDGTTRALSRFEAFVTRSFAKMFPLGASPDYEPGPEHSIAAEAARTGRRPEEVAYDALMADGGTGLLYFPLFNYTGGDMAPIAAMLAHPRTRLGLGDGGAHCGTICDASIPTYMLTHWARDRARGPRLPLAAVVAKQTGQTAALYGFGDRGVVAPGKLADLNLIDFDHLALDAPRMVHDLPAGARRLVQSARGYRATIKRGAVIVEDGTLTGELPGRLVRGPQAA
jgi:N-acyl-D-aspartate/D-glutamate deacylase